MKASLETIPWPYKFFHVINYTFTSHLHNQIEVIYIKSGSCTIIIDTASYTAASGNYIVIFPYQIHSIEYATECEYIVQVFDPDCAPDLIPYLDQAIPQNPVISHPSGDCLDAFLKAEQYDNRQQNTRIIRAYISLYMSFIYDQLIFIPIPKSDSYNVIHNLLLYIDTHYTKQLTLDLLAEELHVTRYYISRLFSQKLHISFTQYVNQLRLNYAIELLQHTKYSILAISLECGFDCERTFYRVFKHYLNTTPQQYRKYPTTYMLRS